MTFHSIIQTIGKQLAMFIISVFSVLALNAFAVDDLPEDMPLYYVPDADQEINDAMRKRQDFLQHPNSVYFKEVFKNVKSMLGIRRKGDQPIPEERITQVGPRINPDNPLPLLRLPVAMERSDDQKIFPGIYTVAIAKLADNQRIITLRQKGLPQLSVAMQHVVEPAGPAEAMSPENLYIRVEAVPAPDMKSIVFHLYEGPQHFESEAILTWQALQQTSVNALDAAY